MNCDKKDLLLYAVTDRAWLNGETLCSHVEKAIKGGATFIQLREKNLDQKHFLEEALEIQKLCKKYNVPFVINDNVEGISIPVLYGDELLVGFLVIQKVTGGNLRIFAERLALHGGGFRRLRAGCFARVSGFLFGTADR